jgi:hypothetical protein
MRLYKFTTDSHREIYINPEHIVSISDDPDTGKARIGVSTGMGFINLSITARNLVLMLNDAGDSIHVPIDL